MSLVLRWSTSIFPLAALMLSRRACYRRYGWWLKPVGRACRRRMLDSLDLEPSHAAILAMAMHVWTPRPRPRPYTVEFGAASAMATWLRPDPSMQRVSIIL